MTQDRKLRVLFLCTGNSCRSQMAEGWTKQLRAREIESYSAGVEKHGLNPLAVKAMAEADVDISSQASSLVEELEVQEFDYVVTLCGHANEHCPFFPGPVKRVHAGFDDPPALAKDAANEEEALVHYRRVRDEIRDFVAAMPGNLDTPA
ncbi:MAG: arsenate reductase ArsC [Desulfovibrio sp.]|nr:MAG: arsenate reductase ArsC [Desulfovibrio sp.]